MGLSTLAGLLLALLLGPERPAERPLDLLFIHHSVGLRWLGLGGLWECLHNPELMGGRRLSLHLATYGDDIGWDTDVRHWPEKFSNQMDRILAFDHHRNVYYRNSDRTNSIVFFKSCYTCTAVKSQGTPPGDATDPERTLWNYKAAMHALAQTVAAYPHVLFVYITSPPLSPLDPGRERNVYPQESNRYDPAEAARYREFCRWLGQEWVPGYRRASGQANLAVFDLFGLLAEPASHPEHPGGLKAAFRNPVDSQPETLAHWTATGAFVPWFTAALDAWEATPWGAAARLGRPFPWLRPADRASGGAGADGHPLHLRLDHIESRALALSVGDRPGAPLSALALGPLAPSPRTLALPLPPWPELQGRTLFFQCHSLTPGSVPGNPLGVRLLPDREPPGRLSHPLQPGK